ncbi:MAG: efflux RND transporter periplasmic adaptor subunit [Chloroflexota bacterium]|nr:efflux RND transporter periplasmic adaptor subunit [Chloroflexota bacterium]
MWRIIAVVAVIGLVVVAGRQMLGAGTGTSELRASGTIEADGYRVSAQTGGRIQSLLADEGDEVTAGQVLVRLDDALLAAEMKKAQAARSAAQAGLGLVQAGARQEDLAKAEAGVRMARAARDGAKVAWDDALAARDNPQELDLRIAAARSQVAVSEARLAQAQAGTDAAQAQSDMWATIADLMSGSQTMCFATPSGPVCTKVSTPRQFTDNASFQWNQASQQVAGAWDNVSLVTAGRDLVRANLDSLLAQRANPLVVNAQVDAAAAQVKVAEATVKEAEAALATARAGASPEQVRVAQAGVAQADAAVLSLQVMLDKSALRAPIAGLVIARSVEEGEMAIPGASLLTLANLNEVRLTLYITEDRIARVRLGQTVRIQVDSFAGRAFQGKVSYISPQAEFTPRAVQTQEERVKTVFAVRVTIANQDHALKPGMPADAVLEDEEGR